MVTTAAGLVAGSAGAASAPDPFSGSALYADVQTYDGFGEHRTATAGDRASALWLQRRLTAAGFTASLQPFTAPLFEPLVHQLTIGGGAVPVFPAWPVTATPPEGLSAPLAPHDAPLIAGKIACVRLPYRNSGTLSAPGFGDVLEQICRRGPAAVVAVTEGPTGEVTALNADLERFHWPAPVVLAGGRYGDSLTHAAAAGQAGVLISTARTTLGATANNVLARRPGVGKTVVVSTPLSGWFHCAGERGSGVAVFLALAEQLARGTDRDLLFIATSGHELAQIGGEHFLKTLAPAPATVDLWLHLGANVAVSAPALESGRPVVTATPGEPRWLMATPDLMAAAATAFAGQPGYEKPTAVTVANAVGELEIFLKAGYARAAGLLGSSPLFHTPLDRADIATTPEILEATAKGARDFLRTVI